MAKGYRKRDYRRCFNDRLRYEGREQQYADALIAVMAERATTNAGACADEARRRCGIKSPDEERSMAEDRERLNPAPPVGRQAESQPVADPADPPMTDKLLGALGLPQNAAFPVIISWVSEHPLMINAREKGSAAIKLSDVNSPPHGRAPSVTAVTMLAYYMTRPGELYKLLAGEQKLSTDEGRAESEREQQEIIKLIKEVKGG